MMTREDFVSILDMVLDSRCRDKSSYVGNILAHDAALRQQLEQQEKEKLTVWEEAAQFCEWAGNDSDSITREQLITIARKLREKPTLSPTLKDIVTQLRTELAAVREECTKWQEIASLRISGDRKWLLEYEQVKQQLADLQAKLASDQVMSDEFARQRDAAIKELERQLAEAQARIKEL